MSGTAKKTDPKLWEKVKDEVTEGDKGGKPGQWSARKAQLAVGEYKKEGGGYEGEKSADNHLKQWTDEDWGTKSGQESGKTGERYLPKEAREHLTKEEYARTTAKKRADTKKGKQFSAQPKDVAEKTADDRETGHAGADTSKAALYAEAKAHDIPGRSKMSKAELQKALGRGAS
ncbi:hypothetical protein [Caulobacter sp. S45]|uniref:hypothetical protein n=1 Tax=Caulobacter sp. S45 TaxID=1641861 RepID=UPI001576A468|nr:hypothetical protein [Caulobacter sp. S45]